MSQRHHICVCICTYKRPHLLAKLLTALDDQHTANLFSYSIVVVDNDVSESARTIVETFKQKSSIDIDCFVEPEQNISLARNKAVENARGDFIAFIDDDEWPESNWLLNLLKTMKEFSPDGVLGPVLPYYPDDIPKWIIKSKLCERPLHRTGTALHWGKTRTGNVLLNRNIFESESESAPFDPNFGKTGSEDTEFFRKMVESGKVFVWCNEAPVYEIVPPDRWSRIFYIQKNLRIGGVAGERIRKIETCYKCAYSLVKSAGWITVMGIFLPFSIVLGQHMQMRAITKIMYSYGVILGFMGRAKTRLRND